MKRETRGGNRLPLMPLWLLVAVGALLLVTSGNLASQGPVADQRGLELGEQPGALAASGIRGSSCKLMASEDRHDCAPMVQWTPSGRSPCNRPLPFLLSSFRW
jgi:hypothetical protein